MGRLVKNFKKYFPFGSVLITKLKVRVTTKISSKLAHWRLRTIPCGCDWVFTVIWNFFRNKFFSKNTDVEENDVIYEKLRKLT